MYTVYFVAEAWMMWYEAAITPEVPKILKEQNMTFTDAETNDTWMLKNAHSASCVPEQGPQRCTLQHLNGALVARSASNKMIPI